MKCARQNACSVKANDHIDQVDNFDFIYAQIKNLRKHLKEAGATPEVKAVYGLGYKMTMD